MTKICKGCSRRFETSRANVKFHTNECREVSTRIRAAEKYLAVLRSRMDEIREYGRCEKVEKFTRNSTARSDSYFVPVERFPDSYEDPGSFSSESDFSTTTAER